jgi:uncharacterized iron-regulated protein
MLFRCIALFALLLIGACAQTGRCPTVDRWILPATGAQIANPLSSNARRAAVLLGEHHDRLADHRWQLASIETLFAANPELAIGFEMFPRAVQPALDEWTGGRLSEAEFLAKVDWARIWGRDPELYLPIFRFARDRRVPMIALNVDRALVNRVAKLGWGAIPQAEREGVTDPAPAAPAYRAWLAEAMGGHGGGGDSGMTLDRFVEAQLVWDRAMAEAIAGAHRFGHRRTVVALIGAGHLERRFGVPHQLAALGVTDTAVFLPASRDEACEPAEADLADALYVTGP